LGVAASERWTLDDGDVNEPPVARTIPTNPHTIRKRPQ
jgi:hypothetical protein